MTFWWWDDAMAVAQGYAVITGHRYRVRQTDGGMWSAERADSPR